MIGRRETLAFGVVLAAAVTGFLGPCLLGGKVLSPADVLLAQASFAGDRGPLYEPANRLLMDPVLQFEPWLEFTRAELRAGRLPLWNPHVGCGAPHLANGQSAVFDPFHLIAYLGRLPDALAWMAAARLWVAGMGMFLLARAWGLGRWGRWFSGLTFPFCGFLVAWLPYPPASVAVWMPWHMLATDRALDEPRPRRVGLLAMATALVLNGGHIQTGAHVLLASAGWAGWRWRSRGGGVPAAWVAGIALGVLAGAIAVVPLAGYLSRSPAWADRRAEHAPPWAFERPRVLEAACTAFPYWMGSQRRGQPNLARALGAENLNEAAGGFVGLATLIWLAPLGWSGRRRDPRLGFLGVLGLVGALGGFGVPPLANALRLVPVLDVIDHRRLTLWVAFALSLLGGAGLDSREMAPASRVWRSWRGAWPIGVAILLAAALLAAVIAPALRGRILAHYERAPVLDWGQQAGLADRQVRNIRTFLPAYYSGCAMQLAVLAALGRAALRGRASASAVKAWLLGLTLADLALFGHGLNPAIDRESYRPPSPLVTRLHQIAPPPARIVGVGAELPPNVLMRYGLDDCRNYDSVELTRSLDWFEPLYEPEPGRGQRSSRREVGWSGVGRALDRLRQAGVVAAVGAEPPPPGVFARVERVGGAWIALIPGSDPPRLSAVGGEITIDARGLRDDRRMIPITYDPGWSAELDGRPVPVEPTRGAFLRVPVAAGSRRLVLRYSPAEVRIALVLTLLGTLASLACVAADGRRAGGADARKNGSRSWMASPHRVKIGSTTSCWSPNRLSTEGRDADGPLHV
jgi:hypothetical protein